MAVVCMDLHVFAERAVLRRATGSGAEVAHLRAKVVAALAAVGARATGMGRVNGHSATHWQYVRERARIYYFPGRLVPEDKGALWDEIAVSAVDVVVQVRAANAGGADLHQDFVCGDMRSLDFRGSQVAGTV